MKKTLFGIVLALSFQTQAKVFRNAYVSFETPDSWQCKLEHTEWVCRSEIEKDSKEAIIVLTAKEVGPTDSFEAYSSHLNTPQPSAYKGATGALSKVVYAPKKVQINDQPWIDGLHMGSEVPNYFTRYLATIKDRIAILVTFSAHKDHYTKYSQDFFKAVMSLRVIATKNLLAKPESGPLRPGGEMLGGSIGAAMPGDLEGVGGDGSGDGAGGFGKTKGMFFILALLLAAVAGYIYIKSKKK